MRRGLRSRRAGSSRRPLQAQSINRLIPNVLTLAALCAGLTGLRFALIGRFELAVLAVLTAALLDGLDGRVARLMNATSRFGAELDSLADFVSFGVVPAVIAYLWSLQGLRGFGWSVALLYVICAALRLARFNTDLENPPPAWRAAFFTGVPSPAGAGLALLPLVASFELPDTMLDGHPGLMAAWLLLVGGLMVSQLPTFAFKRLRVPNAYVLPVLLVLALVTAGLAAEPWWTLVLLGLAYLASLPFAWRAARLRRDAAAPRPADEDRVPSEPPELGRKPATISTQDSNIVVDQGG